MATEKKFPRGRWTPAKWGDLRPAKIVFPVPNLGKDLSINVYSDYNTNVNPEKFVGNLKIEVDSGSASVYYYPVLSNGAGYENGLIWTHPGYPPTPARDYYDDIKLAPRLVAVVHGKTPKSALDRAKREAFYLSKEPDAIGPRIIIPLVINLGAKKNTTYSGSAPAAATPGA